MEGTLGSKGMRVAPAVIGSDHPKRKEQEERRWLKMLVKDNKCVCKKGHERQKEQGIGRIRPLHC